MTRYVEDLDAIRERAQIVKDELANALGDDPNFATTMTNQLAGKQATLSNATEVAKIGNGTFDGKPLVVVSSAEW